MKLSNIVDVIEGFFIRARHKKPGIVTFLIQLAVWIVGIIIIVIFWFKEFYERRIRDGIFALLSVKGRKDNHRDF